MPEFCSNESSEFSLIKGGPLYRIMLRVGLVQGGCGPGLRTVAVFSLVTWLPLLLLSPLHQDGDAIPFLQDFAAHIRLLVAIPVLITGETLIDPRLAEVAMHFINSGHVADQDRPLFDSALKEAAGLRDSTLAEMVIVLLVAAAFVLKRGAESPEFFSTWQTFAGTGTGLTPAGWWYALVSIPVFQFLLYRWLWRLFLWSNFLRRLSRLKLRLIPTHPDLSGGLGFIGVGQMKFGIIIFAAASVISAAAGKKVIYQGAALASFKITLLFFVLLSLLLFLGPLLVFSQKLYQLKRQGLFEYGKLAAEYTRSFDQKWIRESRHDEPILGSSDIQSLADLANSYEIVRKIKLVPFGRETVLALAAAAVLPMFPLLLTVIPLDEIIMRILTVLF